MTSNGNQIEWWSVSPHPDTTKVDEMIVKDYRDVLEGLERGIERFLENADDSDLGGGLRLPFVVKRFTGTQAEFDSIELCEW